MLDSTRLDHSSGGARRTLGALLFTAAILVPFGAAMAQETPGGADQPFAAEQTELLESNAEKLIAPFGFPAVEGLGTVVPDTTPAAVDDQDRENGAVYDAWGAKQNFWLAAAEVFGINLMVWSYNEYIRGAAFTQVSPRSWASNIGDGFYFDDNHFNTNQYAHPFHGSLYYNSARSNGFDYWASAPFAIAGSFMWECCGETHAMAINDWINTSIGGIALGESFYRISGTILDNTATGSERMWREIGGFVTNPVRGFNRLVSGRASRVYENPKEAEDWRALSREVKLSAGIEAVAGPDDVTNPSDSSDVSAFFQVDFRFSNPFAEQRRKPFDFFEFHLEAATGQPHLIERLTIRGNLFMKDLKRAEKTQHVFSIYQNYDYWYNNAYEFGGQSFSFGVDSRFGLGDKLHLATQISGDFMLMGAVDSDFSFVADLPDVERLREYDYGIGGGGRIMAYLFGENAFRYAAIGYRYTFLDTLNGSVVNGSDAYHNIHMAWLQGRIPFGKTFSIGADYFLFLRDSSYSFTLFDNTTQRNPSLRVFATWRTGFAGGGSSSR